MKGQQGGAESSWYGSQVDVRVKWDAAAPHAAFVSFVLKCPGLSESG